VVPPAFGARTLVTLRLVANSVPANGPLAVGVSNANGFQISGELAGETSRAVIAKRRKGRRIALRTRRFEVRPRAKTTVKLALPRKLGRVLKHKGRLSITLRAKVRDPAGHTRSVAKRASLKLKKKPKHRR
jgi:hypothetical protein